MGSIMKFDFGTQSTGAEELLGDQVNAQILNN